MRLHSGSLHFKWAPPHPKPGTCMPMVTSTGGSLSQFSLEPMLPLSWIRKSSEQGQWMRRQEHCAHIRQTHLIKGHLIKDLLRCGGLPGREVGVILVVALAERSGAG